MSKLVRGDRLPANLRREVLAGYPYRWTSDNPERDRAWRNISGAPTMPLISDAQWLAEHAFYVTDRGTLDKRRNKHAQPAYMVEDKSTIRTHHAMKKTAAQLDREIAEAMYANPSEDTGSGESFQRAGTKVSIEPSPKGRRTGLIHKKRKYGVLMEDARVGPAAGWDVYDVRLPDGTETSAYGFDLRVAPSEMLRAAGKASKAGRKALR